MLISNVLRFIFTCPLSLALPITFHCFRHTFATLQIAGGTDLYVVSKMLGHKSIKTTQIYAKIVDSLKDDAANVISLDLDVDSIINEH